MDSRYGGGRPFDPAEAGGVAFIPAGGGRVPASARAWTVNLAGGG
jgi:hypothetical protein